MVRRCTSLVVVPVLLLSRAVLAQPFATAGPGVTTPPPDFKPYSNEYQLDDGTSENSLGLTIGGEVVWINRYTVSAALGPITHVNTSFGTPAFPGQSGVNPGMPFNVYIWHDPNNDGNPQDGALVATGHGIVQASAIDSDNVQQVIVNPAVQPGAPGDSFFIGASVQHPPGFFPAPMDQNGPASDGANSWVTGSTTGPYNPNVVPGNIGLFNMGQIGFPAAFMLRANATPLAPCPPPCWAEVNNAGEVLHNCNLTEGVGPLGSVTGALNGVRDVDMYAIRVVNPGGFMAATTPDLGGSAAFDSQLFLFDESGHGVTHNDDDPQGIGGTRSRITGQFLPGPGIYYLVISGYNRDAVRVDGNNILRIWQDTPFTVERPPDGPGAPGPLTSYIGNGGTGSYTIALLGCEYVGPAAPPPPCATCLGDLNGDLCIDSDDIPPFVKALRTAEENLCGDFEAPLGLGPEDVPPFIALILTPNPNSLTGRQTCSGCVDSWGTNPVPINGISFTEEFVKNPLPADFFGPGSDPFSACVEVEGQRDLASAGRKGPTDTQVRQRERIKYNRRTARIVITKPDPGYDGMVGLEAVEDSPLDPCNVDLPCVVDLQSRIFSVSVPCLAGTTVAQLADSLRDAINNNTALAHAISVTIEDVGSPPLPCTPIDGEDTAALNIVFLDPVVVPRIRVSGGNIPAGQCRALTDPDIGGCTVTDVCGFSMTRADFGMSDAVPIEMVQLNLVSVNPITVTYNGGGSPELWEMHILISPTAPDDTLYPGRLVVRLNDLGNGGTFDASIYVQPWFVFIKLDDIGLVPPQDVNVRVLDTGAAGLPPILMPFLDQPFSIAPPPGVYAEPCAMGNFYPGIEPPSPDGAPEGPGGTTCSSHIPPGNAHYLCPPECLLDVPRCVYDLVGCCTYLIPCTPGACPAFPPHIIEGQCTIMADCPSVPQGAVQPCGGGLCIAFYSIPECQAGPLCP